MAGAAGGADAVPPAVRRQLGVSVQTLRCWEYGSVTLGALEDQEEGALSASHPENPHAGDGSAPAEDGGPISVVSAFFGDPEDPVYRRDITAEVQALLVEGVAAQGPGRPIEVPAVTRLWGDPARFRVKQLEVTYEHRWLSGGERRALEALERRVSEKAQVAPDLEELLARLGVALQGAAGRRPSGSSTPGGAATASASGMDASTTSGAAAPLGATSPRWRLLGFQSNDPRSDLRTGRLALEALVYFAEQYPQIASRLVREAQSNGIDYPFAVASINVTQLLAKYFGLVGDGCGAGGSASSCVAPRRVVRNLARLLAAYEGFETDPFGELQAAVMEHLHARWHAKKEADPLVTVMNFAPTLEETLASVHVFCLRAPLLSTTEFRRLLLLPVGSAGGGRGVGAWLHSDAKGRLGSTLRRQVSSGSVGRTPSDEDTGQTYERLRSSAHSAVTTVSQTAGVFGTYLQGILGDAAAAAVAATAVTTPVAPPSPDAAGRRESVAH